MDGGNFKMKYRDALIIADQCQKLAIKIADAERELNKVMSKLQFAASNETDFQSWSRNETLIQENLIIRTNNITKLLEGIDK